MSAFLSAVLNHQPVAALSGENRYLTWQWQADGVLLLEPRSPASQNVVISAGIHGNETAPVELLCRHVDALLAGDMALNVRLLVILGNLEAMREDKRFIDVDMNRLFSGKHQDYDECEDTRRAKVLEQQVGHFFAGTEKESRLHFDLHTAIRESHYVRFGVLPVLDAQSAESGFLAMLLGMGLEALVLNPVPGGTFSFYTASVYDARSCTLELGKASPFGTNDLTRFEAVDQGLAALISGADKPDISSADTVRYFRVSQELKKYTDDFHFSEIDDDVKNFTSFPQGMLIATDGDVAYRVNHSREWLIFPNAFVRNGLRAGMMLEEVALETLIAPAD